MARVTNSTQAVNQTVNETANQASQAASQGALQDPVFLGAVAAAVLLLPIAFLFKRYSSRIKDRLRPEYQGKSLEDRLNQKQVKPALEFGRGSHTSKQVDYGL